MRSHSTDTGSRLDLMFLKLCSEKPMNKIRIAEISDLAGCNRRTFYNYYKDVDDMKKQIIDRFAQGLDETLKSDKENADYTIIDYLLKHKELLKAFAGKNNFDSEFVLDMIDVYLKNKNIRKAMDSNESIIYPYVYKLFGTLMCVNTWITQEEAGQKSFSEEELTQMILSLQDGTVTV